MKVGLISDTHDNLPAVRAALAEFERRAIDVLLHPGDVVAPFTARLLARCPGTLHITYGNNDGERRGLREVLPQIQDGPLHVALGGRRVLLHHAREWCRGEDVARADVIVTGHTHGAEIERAGDQLFINPGECCGWVTGTCRVAVLDLETLDVESIEVRP